jgi:hypothetical protein
MEMGKGFVWRLKRKKWFLMKRTNMEVRRRKFLLEGGFAKSVKTTISQEGHIVIDVRRKNKGIPRA